jgi:hypothetical protein
LAKQSNVALARSNKSISGVNHLANKLAG